MPRPIVGHVTVHGLEDESGGVVEEGRLSLTSRQDLLEAKLSITGVLETLIGSPGVLRNDVVVFENRIKDIEAGYTLADISTGPLLGMQQEFDLDPNPAVRLEFDRPVTRLEWRRTGTHLEVQKIVEPLCLPLVGCTEVVMGEREVEVVDYGWVPVTYEDGVIEMLLGEEADLMFANGFAELLGVEYFLRDPLFRNETYAVIDPALQIQLLCASFTGLGQTCLFDETYRTEGLFTLPAYTGEWVMQGFQTTRIDMHGGGPSEAVPEPPVLLLLVWGLWSAMGCRCRRRAASAP